MKKYCKVATDGQFVHIIYFLNFKRANILGKLQAYSIYVLSSFPKLYFFQKSCVLSHHDQVQRGSRKAPHIFNLSTRQRWVVGFIFQLFLLWRKGRRYSLARRLGGPPTQCGCCGKEKNSCQESNPCHPVNLLTVLSCLSVRFYHTFSKYLMPLPCSEALLHWSGKGMARILHKETSSTFFF